MKKMTGLFLIIVASIGISVIAEDTNLLAVNNLKDWKGARIINNGKALEVANHQLVYSKIVPINSQNTYVLTGMFKSGNDKKNRVYFGMKFFDAEKRFINPTSVTPINKSETELTVDSKKGAKVIFLKDASTLVNRVKKKCLQIGFESDKGLPNRKLSSKVTALEEKDGVWKATLQSPLPFAAVKGTKVQGHLIGSYYMYAVSTTKNFKNWTKLSGSIRSEVKTGAPAKAIWPGAKFGCIIILANWGQKDGEVLQMKDISLTVKAK